MTDARGPENLPVSESASDSRFDPVQQRMVRYARSVAFRNLDSATVSAAKVRIIDTIAAAIGGYEDDTTRIARDLARDMRTRSGATVFGTDWCVPADIAAFVNGTAARAVEMNDVYHRPGSRNGHPSDVIMPLLAVAEQVRAHGAALITAVVIGYEVYLRLADAARNKSFDAANFCCIGSAVGAGILLGLDETRLAHCISLAVIPNNALNQTRTGHLSMWKSAAAGQAGRAGVFAALLASKGMEGPCLPFTGKHGWCNNVAREAIALHAWGGEAEPYKINESFVKPRAACLHTLAPILAAEKASVALRRSRADIERVTVEVYEAKERSLGSEGNSMAEGEHHWNPRTRETADHSIPYCVAATLLDGSIGPRSFAQARIDDPVLRQLLRNVELRANDAFTADYERLPVRYRARVSATTVGGELVVGETGGEHGDLSDPLDEAQILAKFRSVAETELGSEATARSAELLQAVERCADVSALLPLFKSLGERL
jgi:2-methylcitrate dehydratase